MAFQFFGDQFTGGCPRQGMQGPWGHCSGGYPGAYGGGAYNPFSQFMNLLGGAQHAFAGHPQCAQDSSGCGRGNPQKWQKIVKLPQGFGPSDVEVKADGHRLTIKVSREEGDDVHGKDKREAVRIVDIPESVDMDTVKTLWLRGGQGLMVMGLRKKAAEAADQGREGEARETFQHPFLPFNMDPELFQEQMKTLMEDFQGAFGGCAKGKNEEAAKKEDKDQKSESASDQGHPLSPFNMDPDHLGEQLRTIIEDIHGTFMGQTPANNTPKEKNPQTTTSPTSSDGSSHDKEADSDWVKPELDDVTISEDQGKADPVEQETPQEAQANGGGDEESSVVDLQEYIIETEAAPAPPEATPSSEPHVLTVDCSGYKPSEVTVETTGSKVRVSARHAEESPDGEFEEYSFRRTFVLPENADLQEVTWLVAEDSRVLTISAPLFREHIVKERHIPVEE